MSIACTVIGATDAMPMRDNAPILQALQQGNVSKTLSPSGAPIGRPPIDDDALVMAIIEKIRRGVRLSVALRKMTKTDKDRVRRKVRTVLRRNYSPVRRIA
jgi:hypothetical protein